MIVAERSDLFEHAGGIEIDTTDSEGTLALHVDLSAAFPLNNPESPADVRKLYNRRMAGPLRILFGPLGLQGGGWPLLNLKRLFGEAASLLEVGCGQGLLLEKALRQLEPQRAVGVDLSEVMLQIAWERLRRRGKPEAQVAQAEATTLPFRDACFDGLLSMSMIEHLDESALMNFIL